MVYFLMKRIFLCILSITFIIPILLNAGRNKFVSDIIICSKNDEFTDYQIRKAVYTESFLFNRFLRNESPKTVIKLNINETLKKVRFEIDNNKNLLTIFLNYRLIAERENSFRRDLLKYMILTEYAPQSYDSLNGSWIVHGCWSFIRKSLDKSPNNKEAFPFTKMLLSNNGNLSAEAIVNFNTECGDNLFGMYYSEVSELLILAIIDLPRGRDILNDYIKRASLAPANKYMFFISVLIQYGYDSKQINEALNLRLRKIVLENDQSSDQIKPEIEEYLHDVEKNKIPFGQRYSIYFAVLKENYDLLNIIWPQMDAYLNKEYSMKL